MVSANILIHIYIEMSKIVQIPKKRFLAIHPAAAVGIAVLIIFGCPIKAVTGFACPCCGTVRAFVSAFSGNFGKAFYYNPFFLILPFFVFWYAHRDVFFKKASATRTAKAVSVVFLCLFLLTYIYRIFILKLDI